MELYKSDNSTSTKIQKFILNCENDKDKLFNLIDLLYKNSNNTVIILKALYDNKKDIVIKINDLIKSNHEYNVSNELKDLSNFVKYYCSITCNDDIVNIIKNENMIREYKLCNYGNNPVGILIMNYYEYGSIGSYDWNLENFNILKNVLKQTFFAIIYAYENNGFIHNDLHPYNVLLKPKQVNEIFYGLNIKLDIDFFEVRIIDFEKSMINVVKNKTKNIYLIKDIQRLLSDLSTYNKKIDLIYDNNILNNLKNNEISIDKYYEILNDIIDNLVIRIL